MSAMGLIHGIECLNQDTEYTFDAMMSGARPLRSDCDEQLLVNVAFTQPTRLASVSLQAKKDSDSRPSTLRLFVNEQNVIFANVESLRPTDTVQLKWIPSDSSEDLVSAVAEFPNARYQNATRATFFFVDNVGGDDVTEIFRFEVNGDPSNTTGTSDLPAKK